MADIAVNSGFTREQLVDEPLPWVFQIEAACTRRRAREQLFLLDALTTALSATGIGASKEAQRSHETVRRDMVKRSKSYGNADAK